MLPFYITPEFVELVASSTIPRMIVLILVLRRLMDIEERLPSSVNHFIRKYSWGSSSSSEVYPENTSIVISKGGVGRFSRLVAHRCSACSYVIIFYIPPSWL